MVMVVVAAVMLFYNIKIKKRSPESLWVNQVEAEKARAAAAEAEDAVLAETLLNEEPTQGEAPDPVEAEAETAEATEEKTTDTEEVPAAEAAADAEAVPAAPEDDPDTEEESHGSEN